MSNAALTSPAGGRSLSSLDLYQICSRGMIYLLAFTAAWVMAFPLFWMLICSFKTSSELYQSPPTFFPGVTVMDVAPATVRQRLIDGPADTRYIVPPDRWVAPRAGELFPETSIARTTSAMRSPRAPGRIRAERSSSASP